MKHEIYSLTFVDNIAENEYNIKNVKY